MATHCFLTVQCRTHKHLHTQIPKEVICLEHESLSRDSVKAVLGAAVCLSMPDQRQQVALSNTALLVCWCNTGLGAEFWHCSKHSSALSETHTGTDRQSCTLLQAVGQAGAAGVSAEKEIKKAAAKTPKVGFVS